MNQQQRCQGTKGHARQGNEGAWTGGGGGQLRAWGAGKRGASTQRQERKEPLGVSQAFLPQGLESRKAAVGANSGWRRARAEPVGGGGSGWVTLEGSSHSENTTEWKQLNIQMTVPLSLHEVAGKLGFIPDAQVA